MGVASRLSGVGAEMKMFQTRYGNQLFFSDLDACELGVRDETTGLLLRKERTFMSNSEHLHKTLSLRITHQDTPDRKKHTKTLLLCYSVVARCN